MNKVTESIDLKGNSKDLAFDQIEDNINDFPKDAEKTNGRWAMLGFAALIGAYVTTGQIIPGIY